MIALLLEHKKNFRSKFYSFLTIDKVLLEADLIRYKRLIKSNNIDVDKNLESIRLLDYSKENFDIHNPLLTRINQIVIPLSVLNSLDKTTSKILCIGCRFETELLLLEGYGFKKENIVGLDTFSYSDWVKCGNMHKMDFDDNSFDVILACCVLTYSTDLDSVRSEFARVLKNDGLCVFILGDVHLSAKKTLNTADDISKIYEEIGFKTHAIVSDEIPPSRTTIVKYKGNDGISSKKTKLDRILVMSKDGS